MSTNQPKTKYLSLPAELRIQIMQNVLQPGEISVSGKPAPLHTLSWFSNLCTLVTGARRFVWDKSLVGPPKQEISHAVKIGSVYSMLATCTQIRNEGSDMFFSKNAFILPPGPLEDSLLWLNNLQPANRAALQTLILDFRIQDASPEILREKYPKPGLLNYNPQYPEVGTWDDILKTHLLPLWKQKLTFALDWGHLISAGFYDEPLTCIAQSSRCQCLATRDAQMKTLNRLLETRALWHIEGQVTDILDRLGLEGACWWLTCAEYRRDCTAYERALDTYALRIVVRR